MLKRDPAVSAGCRDDRRVTKARRVGGSFVRTFTCARERRRASGSNYVAEFRQLGSHYRSSIACIDDEPVSVSALCAHLGVSERTLQRAFVECRGVSPRQYKRERRLHAVHGAILASDQDRSVTEVAMGFGF